MKVFTGIHVYFFLALCCCSCQEKQEKLIKDHATLIEFFNSKGRYRRFVNSELIFGDTIRADGNRMLGLKRENGKFLYRKAAYLHESAGDSIIYYMYGIATADTIVEELRIRSFINGTYVGDYPIIDFNKRLGITHDYLTDGRTYLQMIGFKGDKTHKSYYTLNEGVVSNETIVPDSIFRWQGDFSCGGRTVKIYNDFSNKKLIIDSMAYDVEGEIVEWYRGLDCEHYKIVDVGDRKLKGFRYFNLTARCNDTSPLVGLATDSLKTDRLLACMKGAADPVSTPIDLGEIVYVEYE